MARTRTSTRAPKRDTSDRAQRNAHTVSIDRSTASPAKKATHDSRSTRRTSTTRPAHHAAVSKTATLDRRSPASPEALQLDSAVHEALATIPRLTKSQKTELGYLLAA